MLLLAEQNTSFAQGSVFKKWVWTAVTLCDRNPGSSPALCRLQQRDTDRCPSAAKPLGIPKCWMRVHRGTWRDCATMVTVSEHVLTLPSAVWGFQVPEKSVRQSNTSPVVSSGKSYLYKGSPVSPRIFRVCWEARSWGQCGFNTLAHTYLKPTGHTWLATCCIEALMCPSWAVSKGIKVLKWHWAPSATVCQS